MSNKKRREKPGRAAKDPVKYAKLVRDCAHTGPFAIPGRIINLYKQDDPALPIQDDPSARVVGHLLHVERIRCQDCGQLFRIPNFPPSGDPAQHPIVINNGLALMTKIEPDTKIVIPDANERSRIIQLAPSSRRLDS